GESLVRGLENLVADIEANNGELVVRLADEAAFELGGNIATAPGEVIYRNEMMELIQYAPSTEEVHATPIVLFPPWINKFYILDLKEQNSLIRWIVDQGYTLFVISWMNPDASHSELGMEDYVEKG
ncbi:MAG TPA: class I poly(R)-hydroxyalkanoic acid synthase, partial [Roseovarius nubinhibens]|nr:class I poly(R)-hydroxyalkanoic acid synthase [Roseovarius nubinhibens]